MTPLAQVYQRFVHAHYVTRPLRKPEHIAALLEAAAVPTANVDEAFWRQLRSEWLWGVSPAPFDGAHASRANAAYRRLCRRRGIRP